MDNVFTARIVTSRKGGMPMTGGNDARIIQIRDYVTSMRQRIATLRTGAEDRSPHALATAFQEIETAHEELTVADEELRMQAEALESLRAGFSDELRHYRRLFEEAPDGYVVTDGHGIILEANRTLATALHVHPRFLDRKPLISLIVRGDCREFRAALLRLTSGEAVEGLVLSLRPRDAQRPFVAEIHAVPARSGGGRASYIRWAIRLPGRALASNDGPPSDRGAREREDALPHAHAKLAGAIARVTAVARGKGIRLIVVRPDDLRLDANAATAVGAIVESLVMSQLGREVTSVGELHVVIDRQDLAVVVRVACAQVTLPIG